MGHARERLPEEHSVRAKRDEPLNKRESRILAGHGSTFEGIGNRAMLSLLHSGHLQRKARVSQRGDPLEHEADSAADRVMRMQAPTASIAAAKPSKAGGPVAEASGIVGEVLASSGRPLDAQTRAFFEPRFGRDFSNVRIHSDDAAADSAQAIEASAYTSGSHIVFGNGEHRPETTEGQRLLAHELAHVVQQSERGGIGIQREPLPTIPIVERERPADVVASSPTGEQQLLVDRRITHVDEVLIFNQDEGFNERQITEYGEGWIKVADGREQKVAYVTETVTHKSTYEHWNPSSSWTTSRTALLPIEPQFRNKMSRVLIVEKETVKTQEVRNIPKPKPVKKESGGFLSKVASYYKGLGKAVWGFVEGLYHVVRHPIQTLEGLYYMVRHPIKTLTALGNAIEKRVDAILSGDFEALGQTLGDIALLFVAPEAALAKAAKGLKAVKGIEAATALAKALDTDATTLAKAAEGAALAERTGINWNPFKGKSLSEYLPFSKTPKATTTGIIKGKAAAVDFLSLEAGNGGRIWVSTDKVTGAHIEDLTNQLLNGSLSSGKPIDIITGTHGMPAGYQSKEFKFLLEDYGIAPAAKNITFHNSATLTEAHLRVVLQSGSDVILAWCDSEFSRRTIKALGLNVLKTPF